MDWLKPEMTKSISTGPSEARVPALGLILTATRAAMPPHSGGGLAGTRRQPDERRTWTRRPWEAGHPYFVSVYFFFALALILSSVGARAASKSANGSNVIVTKWA